MSLTPKEYVLTHAKSGSNTKEKFCVCGHNKSDHRPGNEPRFCEWYDCGCERFQHDW